MFCQSHIFKNNFSENFWVAESIYRIQYFYSGNMTIRSIINRNTFCNMLCCHCFF